ncbi:hypothetical protein AUL39_04485 [Tractidigestivibacter scatoligenes]|uniref:D-isomer specific 2-hydroxyacid dehydrogenase catalytic domain-containing protein n=1 Tax=Tractidigestivibacter scatoligenes TaxID=1299998 RepID=A0A100YV64_TRASO|nr:hypothetical protein [Tractidigestivibacter scatoligenes]KUH58280.1 hypothetical protein AUL39_04485 [Tractidigestivibacter scatoligenes]
MKVVIAGVFPSTAREKIIDTFPSDWDVAFLRPEDIEREIGTADTLILEHVQVNAALLEKAPALKLVQIGAGYNNVNLDDCTRRGGAYAGIRPLLVQEPHLPGWFQEGAWR